MTQYIIKCIWLQPYLRDCVKTPRGWETIYGTEQYPRIYQDLNQAYRDIHMHTNSPCQYLVEEYNP